MAAEARALTAAGHGVTILACDRAGELPPEGSSAGLRVSRIQHKTTYSRGPGQILSMRFWRAASRFLAEQPAEVIHCHDLDTLAVGIKSGRRQKIPVVFDAHESYPDMVAHLFPAWVVVGIRWLEAFLVPKCNAVITVGEILAKHYQTLGAPKVVVVGNYKTVTEGQLVVPPKLPPLKIIYVGGLNRDRLIAPLIAGHRRE